MELWKSAYDSYPPATYKIQVYDGLMLQREHMDL